MIPEKPEELTEDASGSRMSGGDPGYYEILAVNGRWFPHERG